MAKEVVYLKNISVLEVSPAYRKEVERYLDLVTSTRAGTTLFKYINATGRKLVIRPFQPSAKDKVNAYASAKSEADAYPLDYKIMGTRELPDHTTVPAVWGKGTGKGTDTYVDYHPATWLQMQKNSGRIKTGAGPGEILFHEMVHAYRMELGISRTSDPVPGYPGFDNVEEFYAVLAANVYRSERGFTQLRTDHWGFTSLRRDARGNLQPGRSFLSYPDQFYEEFKSLIGSWFTDDRSFCLAMADVDAKFNPFQYAAVDLGFRTTLGHAMRLPA